MATRRSQRELEQLPHYVYKHFADENLIYVGMTSDIEGRPTDTKRRPWIKTETTHIDVSHGMPYETAMWHERLLISSVQPKYNRNCGDPIAKKRDWRLDRICEVEGVTLTTARWALPYFPKEKNEFEAFLEMRRKS